MVWVSLVHVSACATVGLTNTVVERGDFGTFERSLNKRYYGYQLVVDPTDQFSDQLVERFEVRSGDCSSNSGWSDCENDRERSELKEKYPQENIGSTRWYSWKFYIPPDWPTVYPTKTVLGQFHQIGSHPIWMLLQQKDGLYLDDQTSGFSSRKILLIPAEEFVDKWHYVKIQAKWENDETGLFNVWIDGDEIIQHRGITASENKVYFRFGVYRSFISLFKNSNDTTYLPTQIAFFTDVRMATTESGLN